MTPTPSISPFSTFIIAIFAAISGFLNTTRAPLVKVTPTPSYVNQIPQTPDVWSKYDDEKITFTHPQNWIIKRTDTVKSKYQFEGSYYSVVSPIPNRNTGEDTIFSIAISDKIKNDINAGNINMFDTPQTLHATNTYTQTKIAGHIAKREKIAILPGYGFSFEKVIIDVPEKNMLIILQINDVDGNSLNGEISRWFEPILTSFKIK